MIDSRNVILIDDEEHLRTACRQSLELADLSVETYADAATALTRLSREWAGIVVSDVKMPAMSGLELLEQAHAIDPELPVVLITGHGDIPMAVQAIRAGAYDFIEKPFAADMLVETVRRGLEKRALVLENRSLRAELALATPLERRIVGRSPAMVQLRRQVTSFAATDADVLVLGETGTGKELVARALHELSPRASAPFVAINCAALPESVIESELFGHEAGAFTGAIKAREGKFQYADGGTLFLDEIEGMPLELQARLLRVLQERVVVRLGANREIPVDVRVVAATKSDLRVASQAGHFREDLFYRLDVLSLSIPALRDRSEDIAPLFAHFCAEAASRFRREVPVLHPGDLAALIAHDWPGNVRELQSTALRFVLGFGIEIGGPAVSAGERDAGGADTLADQLARVERVLLQRALAANGHRMKPTYEALGISRKTLYEKLRRHGLAAADEEP